MYRQAEPRKDYLRWVDYHAEASQHCKALYATTKPPATPSPRTMQGRWHKGLITEPLDMAAHHIFYWQEWWCRHSSAMDIGRVLPKLRHMAAREAPKPFTIEDFDNALCSLKEDTSKGLDQVGPRHIKNLPVQGRQAILDLLNRCRARVALPW